MPWQKTLLVPPRSLSPSRLKTKPPRPPLPYSTLSRQAKGCHLVTREIEQHIKEGLSGTKIGILHLFIKHTSAGLTINENYDPGERVWMRIGGWYRVAETGRVSRGRREKRSVEPLDSHGFIC